MLTNNIHKLEDSSMPLSIATKVYTHTHTNKGTAIYNVPDLPESNATVFLRSLLHL